MLEIEHLIVRITLKSLSTTLIYLVAETEKRDMCERVQRTHTVITVRQIHVYFSGLTIEMYEKMHSISL
jgi:hypothetical protein